MSRITFGKRVTLAAMALVLASPAFAQSSTSSDAELRMRKLEAEVRALQRQVFPGGDGKFFAPQVTPGQTTTATTGTPATTPVADLLTRMEAVEAQLARLTAQGEENANRLNKLEAKLAPPAPAAGTTTDGGATTAAPDAGVAAPKPAPTASTKPAVPATPKPAAPSAQRLAAVKAIQKPQSADPGDDEYSYGFRLWESKFYPEAQQQLKLYLEKYPRHARVSFARNLLGRAYLDDGKPHEAAQWFLQNYQADKKGDRAPDSLLYLAEAMRQKKDTNRACVALAQFADDFPKEAAGRLKAQYDASRNAVKCN